MKRLTLAALLIVVTLLFVLATPADSRTFQGRSSWFGGPCDGMSHLQTAHEAWTSTGLWMFSRDLKQAYPGVAIFDHSLARKHVLLTDTHTGRRVVATVLDYGPAPWTGKIVDLDPGAAIGLGFHAYPPKWCVNDYPTGRVLRVTILKRGRAAVWAARTKTSIDRRYLKAVGS